MRGFAALWVLLAALLCPAVAAAPRHAAVVAICAMFDVCRLDSRQLAPVSQIWVKWAVQGGD